MSGLEAASSLFGPADTAADPFGTIGGNDEASSENATHPFDSHPSGPAAEVFDVNGWGSQTQGHDEVHDSATHAAYSWSDADANGYSSHPSNHHDSPTGGPGYPSQDTQYGSGSQWANSGYGEYSQGSHSYNDATGHQAQYDPSYAQSSSSSTYSAYASVPHHQTDAAYLSNDPQNHTSYHDAGGHHASYEPSYTQPLSPRQYIPYAPAPHQQTESAHTVNGTPGYSGQPVYDSYRPTAQAAPARASMTSPSTGSPYDPYRPPLGSPPVAQYSLPATAPTIAKSSPAPSFYPGLAAPVDATPAQSAPVAAMYRPKTLNAYDPPMPPPKPSRHLSSAAFTRALSPSIGRQLPPPSQVHVPSRSTLSPHVGGPALTPSLSHAAYSGLPPSGIQAISPPAPQHQLVAPPPRSPRFPAAPPLSPAQRPSDPAAHADAHPHTFNNGQGILSPYKHSTHGYGATDYVESSPPTQSHSMYSPPTSNIPRPDHAAVQEPSQSYGHEAASTYEPHLDHHEERIDAYKPLAIDEHTVGDFADPEGGDHGLHDGIIEPHPPSEPNHYAPSSPPPSKAYTPNGIPGPGSPRSVRTKSPSSVSVRSFDRGSFDLQRTANMASPPPPITSSAPGPYQPPLPSLVSNGKASMSRVSSPASVRSWKSPHAPAYTPFAPSQATDYSAAATRDRSMSNGSVYSTRSTTVQDPYAPSQRPRQTAPEPSTSSLNGYPSPRAEGNGYDLASAQTLSFSAPVHAPYAPSPSLLGTNDPLGRTSSRAPVMSFGFGGKLVTCCHGAATLNTGFDVALSSRQTTSVQVRLLHTVIPESALDTSSTSFPGPLYGDPGASTSALVRPGASSQAKMNKTRVIKYLDERAEEISLGIGYLTQGSVERRQAEGKLVLVKLLNVMVDNDGSLSGSAQIEAAVRSALVPRLGLTPLPTTPSALKTTAYSVPGLDSLSSTSESAYQTLGLPVSDAHDSVVSTTTVKASSLDKIQEFLMRGDRQKAYHYALDEHLWAHALVIASSVGKDAWKEAVSEFIQAEMGSKSGNTLGPLNSRSKGPVLPAGSNREALKVAYSLFSGQGAACVQELVPIKSLPRMADSLQVASPPQARVTPMSPNFPAPVVTIPAETLAQWAETAAMIIPGPSPAEGSAALLALGDSLLANQWVEAAHACYLLAPQTSVLGGIGTPSGRVVLVGGRSPLTSPNLRVHHDAIMFSEVVEFAMSLAAPVKGQEPFAGFPHLQAYRFIRASSLAELGHVQAANRYCEAIATSLNRTSAYLSPDFVEQLKELTDRFIGAPHLDKSGSWIGGKMTRPSLDSLGNWLEGRFTKFIAGDGEVTPASNGEVAPHEPKLANGPFAHYSTISSTTSSTAPSPQPTVINHNILSDASAFPRRSGSAQALRPAGNSQFQIDRASSAMEYRTVPRTESPIHRISSANTSGYPLNPYAYNPNSYTPRTNRMSEETVPENDVDQGGPAQTSGDSDAAPWWGSSYPDDASVTTPTAATFHPVEQPPSFSGFVSLMDDPSYNMPPVPSSAPATATLPPKLPTHDEEDEDLGLGNSSKRKESSSEAESDKSEPVASKASSKNAPARPDLKSTQGSSWFSKWWSRESTPGPVKATLGEESSFYYDKEQKRWVNKKAGAEASQPATPPPPPARAQTASPGRSAPRMPNGTSPIPPPARAASAIDLSSSPPRRTLARPRSNLVPTEGESTPPPSVTPTPPPVPHGTPTPPPSRPRSQAAKRNIRSRYVDVFQQPEA